MILKSTEEIIGSLERGQFAQDFNAEFHKVLQAVADQDSGTGTVTLKLKITGKDDLVSIASSITTKLPEKPRRTTNLFLTGDGRLSTQHPDQVNMDFRRRDAIDVES